MESGKDPSPYATTKSSLPAAARNRAAALLVKLASNAFNPLLPDEATLAEAERAVEVLTFLKGAPLDHEVGLERRQPHTLARVRRQRVLRPHEVVLGGVRFGFVEPLSERDEPALLVVLPSSEVQDFLRLTGRVECGGVDDRLSTRCSSAPGRSR